MLKATKYSPVNISFIVSKWLLSFYIGSHFSFHLFKIQQINIFLETAGSEQGVGLCGC